MSTPETQPEQRVARPTPDDERGWFGLVLDLLPLPAVLIDSGSGKVVLKNRSAGALSFDAAPELLAAATGADGTAVTWPTADRERRFRVFARPVPPAEGNAPLVLLPFST